MVRSRDRCIVQVPEVVLPLGSLPLLPNGKVNRRGLPEVDFSRQGGGNDYQAPDDDTEARIQAIWHEVGTLQSTPAR